MPHCIISQIAHFLKVIKLETGFLATAPGRCPWEAVQPWCCVDKPPREAVNIPPFDHWRMGDRAEYLLFRSSGEQLWLTLHMASHRIKVHLPTWPAENTLHFTFLLAIALLTPRQLPSPDSCASGLFPSNYFHCHTGSTFFYCEGECRLRQLTCHIIEHLVKRPNFPKGEFQLYQLTHKSYLET